MGILERSRRTRWPGVVHRLSIVSLVVLGGCDTGDAAVDREEALSCEAVSLERDAAEPLEWVGIEGVSDSVLASLVVETRLPEGEPVAELPHRIDPEPAFVAPAHPDGLAGGAFEVRVRTERRTCPFVAFRVLPMEPSPGALEHVVEAVEEAVHARAALFGVSPAELRTADPAGLPPPAVPLVLAQAILDQPLDDPPPDAAGERVLAVVEAAWARDSLARRIRGPEREARKPPSGVFFASAPLVARPASHGWAGSPGVTGAQTPDLWDLCGLEGFDEALEPSAEQLDCMMETAVNADIASTGEAKAIFEKLQTTLTIAEVVAEAAQNKLLQFLYSLLGKAATVYMAAAEALARLLPSSLERLDVTVDPVTFPEDHAGPGVVSEMTVVALSRGWKMEERLVDDLANLASGEQASVHLQDLIKAASDEVKARTADDAWGEVGDIPAMEFGPTDISDPDWSHVVLDGDAFTKIDHLTFAPRGVGRATLLIQSREIGYQVIRTERVLEVNPIRVEVEPSRTTVSPGEPVTFTATVENALDRTLSWQVMEPGHRLVTAGEERLGATLVTSDDPATFPIRIRVESAADRSHLLQVRPRLAEARVSRYAIRISPAGLCIQPGERGRFEAELPEVDVGGVVLPGEESSVRWSATAGRIDDRGWFQAPDEAVGSVTITARSLDDPDLEDEAVIRVGGCSCWMAGTLGPPLVAPVSGLAHLEPGGGLFPPGVRVSGDILSLTDAVGYGADRGSLSLRFEVPGLADGSETVLHVNHAFAEVTGRFAAMIDPSAPRSGSGTVRVTRRSEGVVEGHVTATLTVFSEDGEILRRGESYPTRVSARFRAVTGSRADRTSAWTRCRMEAAGVAAPR